MCKFSLFILLFILAQNVFGQITIEQELHDYVVEDLDNYQESITMIGENRSSSEQTLGFLVGESAELLHYQLYERKGTKWKPSKLKKKMTVSSIDRSAFFTGTRYYYFPIPAGVEFKLEFSTQEKHTIFLTKLHRTGWFDAEWVKYSFELPSDLLLTTRGGHIFEGDFTINDSVYGGNSSMPYIIHPRKTNYIDYFSTWFTDRINPQMEIDPSLIPEELTEIMKTGSQLELAKACFQFVQREIKYIDIENGINAIVPRQCEKVLKNGLGDCKDMATLLTALYRYFGFEAYTAISRTNSKSDTLNFPSLGLANHTICVLNFSDEWYFLDATEDACLFGDPSIQILGTEVFLVDYDGDPFLQVDDAPRSKSVAQLNYTLDENMNLVLEMKTFGKMNHFLYHTQLKERNPSKVIKSVLKQISGLTWKINEVVILDSVSIVNASAVMNPSMYSKMGSKNLYNLKFLPTPKLMSALFQNSAYPKFNGSVEIALAFGGEIRSDFSGLGVEGLEIIQGDEDLKLNCQLIKTSDANAFKQSAFVKEWNELIKAPLVVGYEE